MGPACLAMLCWLGLGASEPSPQLRHAAYLALLPSAATTTVHLTSTRHSQTYADPLAWRLVTGETELQHGRVSLGEQGDVTAALPDRLVVLALEAGWNLASATVEGASAGVVCDASHEVAIVGPGRFSIYQPAGEAARVAVGASVASEGCRVTLALGEQLLADERGDYDQPKVFAVPAAAQAQILTLTIGKPDAPGLQLDDVELRLVAGTAPYLAWDAASARTLGERWLAWRATQ